MIIGTDIRHLPLIRLFLLVLHHAAILLLTAVDSLTSIGEVLLMLDPELTRIGPPAFPVDGGLPRRDPSLGYLEMLDPSSACTKEKRYCYNYVVADVVMHYIARENHGQSPCS